MKKLTLETTAPFQGLAELVADKEGLFEEQGLQIQWVDREKNVDKSVDQNVTSHEGVNPFASHGKLFEQGKADMYNACEWGNYCRVQDSKLGGRQVGRRAIVTYGALVVSPDSSAYTPQQMAGKTVGLPYYFGTHFLALLLLEGFLPREQIKTCSTPNGSRRQYDAMLRGDYDGACLTEPYISLAEKQGCRVLASASFHGTEVVSEKIDTETYAAFNRAVTEAVGKIKENKLKYMNYFIDYYKDRDPEIFRVLTLGDLTPSRIIVQKPMPIPEPELQRSYEWIRSWGLLSETERAGSLVDQKSQNTIHSAAE